ncbi:hypothetical protein KIN20_031732 [Parelaphostrongylus tenuis]|uniref:Uncharacterized protein n=1 Tax=Parelaphostrongylus tenuis TaxID=148309 RepID=A0AAD5R5X2_PARTN|nr:hypothetical protein KIN20_031732 [Parelaphostrongylus tenuis]
MDLFHFQAYYSYNYSHFRASIHHESDTDMSQYEHHEDPYIVRHPIRVELLRNLGAARIRLEGFDRTGNRDIHSREILSVQVEDGDGRFETRHDEADRDADIRTGMFVFADEGPPSDDEELGDENRMGLQWINAILGFEREIQDYRNYERVQSDSPTDDSSSEASMDEEPSDNVADKSVRHASVQGNHDSGHRNGANPTNGGSTSFDFSSLPEILSDGEVEEIGNDDNKEKFGEKNGKEDLDSSTPPDLSMKTHTTDIRCSGIDGTEQTNGDKQTTRNEAPSAGPSRRSASRPLMSRRSAKKARISNPNNGNDESEKLAQVERERQEASLARFGEAFNDAMWKLPLPRHLIKYLTLHSMTPVFVPNEASEGR